MIGLGKLDEAAALLRQIDVPAVAQLSGDPDWGAGVTLAQAEIAYRKGNYREAHSDLKTIEPVLTEKDEEPFQKRVFESLKAALDKAQSQN